MATILLFVATTPPPTITYAEPELKVVMIMEAKTDKPDVELKIRKAFPEDYELMIRVAQCESGLNQDAVSHTNDWGVFQVNKPTWHAVAEELGLDYQNDVDDNIEMARYIYEVQGINAWVCYTKKMI